MTTIESFARHFFGPYVRGEETIFWTIASITLAIAFAISL